MELYNTASIDQLATDATKVFLENYGKQTDAAKAYATILTDALKTFSTSTGTVDVHSLSNWYTAETNKLFPIALCEQKKGTEKPAHKAGFDAMVKPIRRLKDDIEKHGGEYTVEVKSSKAKGTRSVVIGFIGQATLAKRAELEAAEQAEQAERDAAIAKDIADNAEKIRLSKTPRENAETALAWMRQEFTGFDLLEILSEMRLILQDMTVPVAVPAGNHKAENAMQLAMQAASENRKAS